MQREIKFRGKRLDTGEWIYGDLLGGTTRQQSICDPHAQTAHDDTHEVDPATVGQYTGRKNFYHKDIAETNGIDGRQLWLVEWEESCGVIGFVPRCITGEYSSVHNNVWEDGKVITNIHDTANPLEGSNEQ